MGRADDPTRFKHSRDVGPHFGLTPKKYQSGELDVTGAVTKRGDRMVTPLRIYDEAIVERRFAPAIMLDGAAIKDRMMWQR